MLWRDQVTLIGITYERNNIGDNIEKPHNTIVFANKKDVRQSEFYQAMATGLRPELMFEIRSVDYDDQQKLKYLGKEYQVIRTYSKNGEVTEVICRGLSVHGQNATSS